MERKDTRNYVLEPNAKVLMEHICWREKFLYRNAFARERMVVFFFNMESVESVFNSGGNIIVDESQRGEE